MNLQNIHDILALLEQNEVLSARSINMVPSENSMSGLAKLPLLLDIYHRYYFFNNEEFRGGEMVAHLENDLAQGLLREFTGAEFVNLRPLSGLNGMTLILAALSGGPGTTIMAVAGEQGGHYATRNIATLLGLNVCYLTGPDPHTIDFDKMASTLLEYKPALIYIDQSNCLFPLDIKQLIAVKRKVLPDTLVHVDASHWMGLIFGKQMLNPLELGADSLGGSLHKTFPGPQKAIFATRQRDIAERVRSTQAHLISSHHFGATISLALALLEFKQCGGAQYAANVISNTKELGRLLHQYGLDVEGADRGFSQGHQLWVRTTPFGIDPSTASQKLYNINIRVNAYPVLPVSSEPFLRLGVNEPSYHGLQLSDMSELAAIFVAALQDTEPTERLTERVAILRRKYTMPYSFPSYKEELLTPALRTFLRVMTQDHLEDEGIKEAYSNLFHKTDSERN